MAEGIKISALTEATDAQMTDAGLIETAISDTGSSTGFSSKKASLSRFAGYILNKFSGLSLAGASQTVKAAIDKVFTNSYMDVGTTIESATNLNTITTVGKYSARTTTVSSLLNCPTTTGFSMYVEIFTTSGKKQTIIDNNGATYTRINISNNTTSWTDWAKQPTRAEIDSLNSNSYLLSYASTAMKNGDDLNDYKTAGMYHSLTNAITSSLLHKPSWVTTGWLKLYVEMMSGGVRRQTLVNYNGSTLVLLSTSIRYMNEAGTTITDWVIEPTASEIGSLSSLTTTAKTNLVAAVNEVNAAINSLVDGNEVSY